VVDDALQRWGEKKTLEAAFMEREFRDAFLERVSEATASAMQWRNG
jgi:hypothetical protein